MIRSFVKWIDRLHWLWLALAAPFLLFPSPKRSLAMLVVPGSWLLHWLVVSRLRREGGGRPISTTCNLKPGTHNLPSPLAKQYSPLSITPLNGALLLMFCMLLISLWATYDIAVSLPKICGIVLGFGVFFAVARAGERPRGWILSLLAFLGIGLGVAALGLFGTSWATSKITFLDSIMAHIPTFIQGLQGSETGFNPNEVAGALTWVLPLMIALSVVLLSPLQKQPDHAGHPGTRREWVAKDVGKQAAAKKVRRWRLPVTVLCLLGGLFVGAVFLLAQSRSAYIGLVLTLLAFLMIVLPARWRWYSLIALVVLAALLGLLVASHWEMVHTWIGGSDQAANSELSLNSLEGRLEVWSSAIYGIQDFPFTGMGMNTFRKVVPVLYPLFTISPDIDIGHAHNEFLQAALDLGIPGLIAFLALYIGAFWMLWDIGKEVSDAKGQASSVGRSRLSFLDSLTLAKAIVLGLGGGLLPLMPGFFRGSPRA